MAPGGLVEVRVSWPEHPRYLKNIYIYKCVTFIPSFISFDPYSLEIIE